MTSEVALIDEVLQKFVESKIKIKEPIPIKTMRCNFRTMWMGTTTVTGKGKAYFQGQEDNSTSYYGEVVVDGVTLSAGSVNKGLTFCFEFANSLKLTPTTQSNAVDITVVLY